MSIHQLFRCLVPFVGRLHPFLDWNSTSCKNKKEFEQKNSGRTRNGWKLRRPFDRLHWCHVGTAVVWLPLLDRAGTKSCSDWPNEGSAERSRIVAAELTDSVDPEVSRIRMVIWLMNWSLLNSESSSTSTMRFYKSLERIKSQSNYIWPTMRCR